ncbi:hypothetical protein MTR67_040209 [Solanum verrucosum]|uniref:Chromo domain-containing protein n=1 Tax=Solanum verrucosum TaxID=315347 RepID=A0AAF0UJ48_SOLVR|nr:hypothetical protein MTR67_040209 [Solanum verrucosum]
MKDVMRFSKKGKLSPRVGSGLSFGIRSHLRPSSLGRDIYLLKILVLRTTYLMKRYLVEILDRQVRKLRTKEVASVKVLWRNQVVEKATWETEEDMKKRYNISLLQEKFPTKVMIFVKHSFN